MRATSTSITWWIYRRKVLIVSNSIYSFKHIESFISCFTEWQVVDTSKDLEGFTHQSQTIDSKSRFGTIFTVDLSKPFVKDADEQISFSAPLLLLEVYNVNFWNRQRSVGYGFTHLRLDPGCHVDLVPTWRPQRKGPGGMLEEHFLGLAPQVENVNYAGIPSDVSLFILPNRRLVQNIV